MKFLSIFQGIVSVLLIVSILLQNRGSGLGGAFGGGSTDYYTRRGFEKFLVYGSVFLAILFLASALVSAYLLSRG